MANQIADKRGTYMKADIDRLNDVATRMLRQEEADRRAKTEHLRALRLAKSSGTVDTNAVDRSSDQ